MAAVTHRLARLGYRHIGSFADWRPLEFDHDLRLVTIFSSRRQIRTVRITGSLSRLKQSYCQEATNFLRYASILSSVGAVVTVCTLLQTLSALQSFTPSGNSVPLAQRFVKAYDVQVLIWGVTGIKFHLVVAICLVVRALGQLSRKCPGALLGHVALVLAIYEVVKWTTWHRFLMDTYMPGVDVVTGLGEILLGLVLLILVANDLGVTHCRCHSLRQKQLSRGLIPEYDAGATHMNTSVRKPWLGAAVLLGVVYFVIGIGFGVFASRAASNSMRETWNRLAFVSSAVAFAVHICHEHFRLRDSTLKTAWHVSIGVALGGFLLAVNANVHGLWVGSGNRRLLAVALVAWPALTGVPAFLVALIAAAGLSLVRKNR